MSPAAAMIDPMRTRTVAALAATVAVTVVLTGCAPATTAGTAVAPSGAVEASAPPERVEAPAVYRDVSRQGERFDTHPTDPTQWGPAPLPGSLLIPIPNRGQWTATLGPAVTGAEHPAANGWLTAAHVAPEGSMVGIFTDAGEETDLYLGVLADTVDRGAVDRGLIWTYDLPLDTAATRVAGYPIAGVMTRAAVRDLPPGTPICLAGARAGTVCSPKRAGDPAVLLFDNRAGGGDSGAPVFVVDSAGNALLIGLLAGSADTAERIARATLLEPVLRDLGLRAVTARGVMPVDPELVSAELADPR